MATTVYVLALIWKCLANESKMANARRSTKPSICGKNRDLHWPSGC